MKKKENVELNIFLRYMSLIFLIFFFTNDLFINAMIYIYTYLSYFFLNMFTTVVLAELMLFLDNGSLFLIVEECIAPNAYMLISLVFLTLFFDIKILSKILFKSLILFSFFNLIRIFILMWIHVIFGEYYFYKYHLIFYQGLSGIVTALIVIYYLRKEKISKIYPIYSDVRYLIKSLKKK